MRRRHTAEERERLIAEVRSSGETARVVAERMGVCASSAYRWMKEVAGAAATGRGMPVFARVVPGRVLPRSELAVEIGGATIRVEAGFDAELLRAVVAALGDCA
jgi:transposase-like protein